MTNFPGVINQVAAAIKRRTIKLRYYQQHVKDGIWQHWGAAPADQPFNVMAVMPTGAGKCLAPGTPVMMHDGSIIPVEEIRVGDLLMGPDSGPRRVLSLARGRERMYRVVPTKGDPYTVNESHILSLRRTAERSNPRFPCRDKAGEIVNISVREYLSKSATWRHIHKGYRASVDFATSKPLPLDAWLIGAWLGDGTTGKAAITTGDHEIIREFHDYADGAGLRVRSEYNSEGSIIMHLSEKVGRCGRRGGVFGNALRELGIFNKKDIPLRLRTASRDDRLNLLAGLIDTDGYYSGKGYDITLKSENLIDGVIFIARSLGFSAYKSKRKKKCGNNGVIGDYFSCSISGDVDRIPCRIERKKANPRLQKKNVLNVGIKVEPVGEGDYYGFTIDGDHLFLLGDFTVTHNTVLFTDILSEHTGAAVAIAHRQELVAQISLTLNSFGVRHRLICPPKVRKLIIARHLKEQGVTFHDAGAMVGVGGVDTIVGLTNKPEFDTWRRSVTLGVQDEAHHVLAANKWGKATLEFPACKRWLFVTATPERPDGRGLGRHADGLADALVVGPGMRELIDDGYLCDYKVWTIPHKVDYSSVSVGASGEYVQAKLVAAEECDKKLVGNIVNTYKARVPGKRAICFMSSVAKAEETAEAFRQAGVPALAVDGKSGDDERARAMEDLASGKILVLVNCDLVGEGVDVPAVEVVIMGTRTASFIRFTQWWGRMLRLALSPAAKDGYDLLDSAGRRQRIADSDKPFGVVIDHGGNLIQHNGPPDLRVTPWTLDRRERRGSGPSDAIPYRVCANRWEDPDGMTWEEARALGLSDQDLEDCGMLTERSPLMPVCAHPYAAVHRCCPMCGYMPMPARRSAPEEVDGDLQLLDTEALAALAAKAQQARQTPGEYREYLASTGLSAMKVEANVKRHREKLAAHDELDRAMGEFGGKWHSAGETDSQIQRRFFLSFGLDVMSVQALDRAGAIKLAERIDATVKGA